MEKIIIVNKINQIKQIAKESIQKDVKIFAVNYQSHGEMKKNRIKHENYSELLTGQERDDLYDFVIQKYNWYEKNKLSKNFCYEGLNIFEIMDVGEFHENLLKICIEGNVIKKIIEQSKPSTVICSKEIGDFIKNNFDGIKYLSFKTEPEQKLMYEKIDLKFNIGKNPITIKVSKNNYQKLKKYFEKITCSLFNLWYKQPSKQLILLTEFNPSMFRKLILTLSKEYTVVFLNFRRPASWNLESIKILKETNSKIINTEDSVVNENIKKITKDHINKLEKIFQEKEFYEIFKFNNISFWPMLSNNLKNIFLERISNYIRQILIMKNIVKKLDLKCFFCLNEAGESEKLLLKINKNKNKSVLLLHGFHNFHKETEEIRMRYDYMGVNILKSSKFFVWGENDFKYYQKLGIDKSKISIVGSPKFDDYKLNNYTKNKQKIILITPEPITEYSGHGTIELAEIYEKTIKKICNTINEFKDIEIIVKLHPGQNDHNQNLMEIFKQIDPNIPVFQIKPSKEMVSQCDLLLNITCESFDPSTIMLEGLILEKPVLEILLDDNKYKISNDAIITVSYKDDLKKHIQNMLFNQKFEKTNIENQRKILKNYLSYQSKSSDKILEIINEWK